MTLKAEAVEYQICEELKEQLRQQEEINRNYIIEVEDLFKLVQECQEREKDHQKEKNKVTTLKDQQTYLQSQIRYLERELEGNKEKLDKMDKEYRAQNMKIIELETLVDQQDQEIRSSQALLASYKQQYEVILENFTIAECIMKEQQIELKELQEGKKHLELLQQQHKRYQQQSTIRKSYISETKSKIQPLNMVKWVSEFNTSPNDQQLISLNDLSIAESEEIHETHLKIEKHFGKKIRLGKCIELIDGALKQISANQAEFHKAKEVY